MSLVVRSPGFRDTVQDRGRFGLYNSGIPPAGAQDQFAYRVANYLLDNDENAAAFELTIQGGEYEFAIDTQIALTGADLSPALNGEPVPMWEVVRVSAGDVLSFGPQQSGCRAYLAVAGGVDVPVELGSRSTYLMGNLGGFNGRELEAADEVPLGTPAGDEIGGRRVPESLRPEYGHEWTLDFVTGVESELYTDESIEDFFSRLWEVKSSSDRVGYRFKNDGATIEYKDVDTGGGDDPSNVPSNPYPIGTIEIPSGDEPILLANDAVTFGGFAVLGAVTTVDMNLLGQIQPGDLVAFNDVTLAEAKERRNQWNATLDEISRSITR